MECLFRQNQLVALISQFTEKEAKNFSVFLNEILMELRRWHVDKALYEKDGYGTIKGTPFPGFSLGTDANGMGVQSKLIDYEKFRGLMAGWHTKLFGALKACLQSGEYMQIRNSFQILKGVHNWFPIINFQGTKLYDEVTLLSTKDPRDDVRLSATSLLGDLKKHMKEWVPIQAFRLVQSPYPFVLCLSNGFDQGPGPATGDSPVATKPAQSASAPTSLNAKAPEFKPIPASTYVYPVAMVCKTRCA